MCLHVALELYPTRRIVFEASPYLYLDSVMVHECMCSLVDISFLYVPHSCVCLSLPFQDVPLCINNSTKEHSRTVQFQFPRPLNISRFKDFILKSSSEDILNFVQGSTFICASWCIVVFVLNLSFYHLASIAQVTSKYNFYYSFA